MNRVAFLGVLLAAACSRDTPRVEPRTASATPSHLPPAEPFRLPAVSRLVAIGDVHGDLEATRGALRLAGAISDGDRWTGGELVVVQTGDQIDRGDDDRAILDLLDVLAEQAKKSGGALHVLNGNHETLNVAGDFRYVTEGAYRAFDDLAGELRPRPGADVPSSARGRAAAFFPGGPYARRLSNRRTILIVGNTVFAHGGVTPGHVSYGIERINVEIATWMRGEARTPPAPATDPEGPVWSRVYSAEESPPDCGGLGRTLDALRVERMVVGHTPQKNGITSACGDRVWRIDVGMSRYYGGSIEVLDLSGGQVRARRSGE